MGRQLSYLDLLLGWPKENLVDVDVFGLTDGEADSPREGVSSISEPPQHPLPVILNLLPRGPVESSSPIIARSSTALAAGLLTGMRSEVSH